MIPTFVLPSPTDVIPRRDSESSGGSLWSICGMTPRQGMPVRSSIMRMPSSKYSFFPRKLLYSTALILLRSPSGISIIVPRT